VLARHPRPHRRQAAVDGRRKRLVDDAQVRPWDLDPLLAPPGRGLRPPPFVALEVLLYVITPR
jgi:hypothetical protein